MAATRYKRLAAAAAIAAPLMCCALAHAGQPLRIMLIDPLSGPQSATMQATSRNLEYAVKRDNDAGGLLGQKIELTTCDSKFNPKDAKSCLDRAIGSDIHYILQGVGNNVTMTLLDAIDKYNARNPGKEMVLINWAGLDEETTNQYCSFWQFRTQAHLGMELKGAILSLDPGVKRVYLINMDYSSGQDADAVTKRMLKQFRPDIQVIGSELFPPDRVQDFTPYVAKIKSAHADVVITAAIGTDLNRLIGAGNEVGLDARWYTVYASQHGQLPAIGPKGVNRVYQASDSVMSMNLPTIDKLVEQSRADGYGDFESVRMYRAYRFLTNAVGKAGTAQPLAVAKAMETTTVTFDNYSATIRASDHQAQMPVYLSVMSPDAKFKQDGTPWGFKVLKTFGSEQMSEPTTCQMKRPPGA
ncbi:branched-chain amino acid ABC transporter substrate-binding protein [Paraburkholderia youngii]|uniref:branched-chain amino acid ABC transporter substrate-binding protein n=1 Tax=Paraburkholderia youngii TaxID=2782701 RepID=UPI0015909235|nr:branched-chain amino acid ABC transporter substrate-binding protein [Paraburkholderia youngii]